jgi:predicted nucleotidyltransferase
MTKDDVIARLRHHRRELEALGIDHLFVFGSVARGEHTSASDVDLLAEFNPSARIGFGIVGIQLRLEEIVGRPVDLVRSPVNKPRLKQAIDREVVLAF